MVEREGASGRSAERKQDRSWLATYLLMMLRTWNAYGYELVRQLTLFGFGAIDPANVYRALRELERDGYVTSAWDTSISSGPARRVYTITEAGIEALQLWSSALDNYRQSLDRFFNLYQSGFPAPSPMPEGVRRVEEATEACPKRASERAAADDGATTEEGQTAESDSASR